MDNIRNAGPSSSPKDYGFIAWSSPPSKLNTDGCSKGNPGPAGFGSVIQDSAGKWVIGFFAHLGGCNSLVTELEAIWVGLELVWNEGLRDMICEVDALSVIQILSWDPLLSDPLVGLVNDCRLLLSHGWTCTLIHTLCEGNACADEKIRANFLWYFHLQRLLCTS